MKGFSRTAILGGLVVAASLSLPAQGPPETQNRGENIETYINLLRTDIKTWKVQILTAMLQFTPEEASQFWSVYKHYAAELTKLGDQKVALIEDYAAHYGSLTDAQTDELIKKALDLEFQRISLKQKYYEQVKNKMGAKPAAHFLQVENQLLMLIDLKIAASLPAVE